MSLDNPFRSGATMRAVRIGSDHRIGLAEVPVPLPQEGQILVRPCACGICGTDLHILEHGFPGTAYPCTPGHEFAGHVVGCGPGVTGIKEGDFVAVDPNVTCGTCRWCMMGRPNLCVRLQPIGVGLPGAAADYVVAPARNAIAVSGSMAPTVAAMIEPLACVLNAVRAAGPSADRSVVVLGAGAMGLLSAIVFDHQGTGQVTIADPSPAKQAIARGAGIERAVAPADLEGMKFDIVIEAAGAGAALEQALRLVDKTGTLVQVGVHHEDAVAGFRPFKVYEDEIRIIGSNSCADRFPAAAELMPDLAARIEPLVRQDHSVWDFEAAVRAMAAGTSIKTQLIFD